MHRWREMCGSELEPGYWVAVPYRWGEQGNQPLTGGWYEVKSLREDDDGDWIIGLGSRRFQWLLKHDTIAACERNPISPEPFVYVRYEQAANLRPGHQIFIRKTIEGWFDITDYPARIENEKNDQLIVSLVIRETQEFGLGGVVLTRDRRDPDDAV